MKTASITVTPTVELRRLPKYETDICRRLFTQHLRGATPEDHKRWIRLVADWWNAKPGEGFQLYRVEGRSGAFHALHRAILSAIFERQERFPTVDALHDAIKLKTWFVEWKDGKPTPKSTSFDACSEDEIRELAQRLQHLLHDPDFQAFLWPALPERLRLENVTAILTNPKEAHE